MNAMQPINGKNNNVIKPAVCGIAERDKVLDIFSQFQMSR